MAISVNNSEDSKEREEQAPHSFFNDYEDFEFIDGIEYRVSENDRGEKEPQLLDVYFPKRESVEELLPVIIWIHGGGFARGVCDRKQGYIKSFSKRFARHGYICFSVDYRLRNRPMDYFAEIMDASEDIVHAVEWVRKNAAQYGGDGTRIVIGGGSAGGMLADSVIYGDGKSNHVIENQEGIKALVSLWGAPGKFVDCGFSARENCPPAIFFHGTEDPAVPYEKSVQLANLISEHNIPSVVIPIHGAGHTPMTFKEEMDVILKTWLYHYINL